jgi:hypothetical protein
MSLLNRRQSFKVFLDGLLQTAGSVVLASSVLPARAAEQAAAGCSEEATKDLEQRANQLAGSTAQQSSSWINGAFANGGFNNGGFRNGGFNNGAFRNGGFANGGFNNGGFRNGGFVNGAWRN